MTCPECRGKTEVLETRESQHGTRRRRRCRECRYRFTTFEVLVVQIVEQHARVDVDVPDAAEIASEVVSELGDLIEDRLADLPDEVVEALLAVAEAERRSLGSSTNGDRLLALPAGDDEDDEEGDDD